MQAKQLTALEQLYQQMKQQNGLQKESLGLDQPLANRDP